MKYKDYLILPVVMMYIVYASCAYVGGETGHKSEAPKAVISPLNVDWGNRNGSGEIWYATENCDLSGFSVNKDTKGIISVSVIEGKYRKNRQNAEYCVYNDHLRCSGTENSYDIIFLDEMTAYETGTGIYYVRGDAENMKEQLSSGCFVSVTDPNAYIVFKDNGKAIEYSGDKVYKGEWKISSCSSMAVTGKNRTGETVEICYDEYGNISSVNYKDDHYILSV